MSTPYLWQLGEELASKTGIPQLLTTKLAVPGPIPKHEHDRYGRIFTSKLAKQHPHLTGRPGWGTLKEDKWWPASFVALNGIVSTFLSDIRRASNLHIIVVVVAEYAAELVKQLCHSSDRGARGLPMEEGEFRTYRLTGDGTQPAVFVPAQSYKLQRRQSRSDDAQKKHIEVLASRYGDVKDTCYNVMRSKAAAIISQFIGDVLAKRRKDDEDRQARIDAAKANKHLEGITTCSFCNADLMMFTLNDTASGDRICSKCGWVVTAHQMNEGPDRRTFQDDADPNKNHCQTSMSDTDRLMSTQTQMQTGYCGMPASKLVDQMMLEDVKTRDNQTTQQTKDKHTRMACTLYSRLQDTPDAQVSVDVLKMAAEIFQWYRNKEVSLQPIGRSKSHRPRDDTLCQWIVLCLMAAETYYQNLNSALPPYHYVPVPILTASSWHQKRERALARAAETDQPVALGRPKKRARMTSATGMRERAEALMKRRRAS